MALVLVIGPGRVGTALALALRELGHEVRAAGGGAASRGRYRALMGEQPLADLREAASLRADMHFLTVPDRRVAAVASELAGLGAFSRGQLVTHLSGALPAAALAPAGSFGADLLGLHPLVAIADPALGAEAFRGTVCTLEGSAPARARGEDLVRQLGGVPWQVEVLQKARIHAAAVLASNAMVALLSAAVDTAAIDEAQAELGLAALLPLAEGALRNVRSRGLAGALTGPVERGDVDTVRRHLAVLPREARDLYRALLIPLVRLSRRKGTISPQTAEDLILIASEVHPGWRDE